MSTTTTTTFRFNKDYKDLDQVAQFLPAFLDVYTDIVATGRYTYNDSFRGRIVGLDAATPKDEDTAIYMLQTLKNIRELEAKVESCLADGYAPVDSDSLTTTTKFHKIVEYGFYMGGTGWREWTEARLVPSSKPAGGWLTVLPKGKRTHGHLINGKVLVKR